MVKSNLPSQLVNYNCLEQITVKKFAQTFLKFALQYNVITIKKSSSNLV
jgi:hypothetical protein